MYGIARLRLSCAWSSAASLCVVAYRASLVVSLSDVLAVVIWSRLISRARMQVVEALTRTSFSELAPLYRCRRNVWCIILVSLWCAKAARNPMCAVHGLATDDTRRTGTAECVPNASARSTTRSMRGPVPRMISTNNTGTTSIPALHLRMGGDFL